MRAESRRELYAGKERPTLATKLFDTSLSIIIPAYNEEVNLANNLPAIASALDSVTKDFEIIVVDDGSSDSTADVVKKFMETDPRVRCHRHPVNMGPGSGLVTGIPLATKDYVLFLPADIAMRLDQLDRFLLAAQNADVVVGVSSDRTDYSPIRKLSSAVYVLLVRILFGLKFRQVNYIHLYSREAITKCAPTIGGVFVSVEILVKARDAGFRLVEADVEYLAREHGSASCGKPSVILKTISDAFSFWWKWRLDKRTK